MWWFSELTSHIQSKPCRGFSVMAEHVFLHFEWHLKRLCKTVSLLLKLVKGRPCPVCVQKAAYNVTCRDMWFCLSRKIFEWLASSLTLAFMCRTLVRLPPHKWRRVVQPELALRWYLVLFSYSDFCVIHLPIVCFLKLASPALHLFIFFALVCLFGFQPI